MKKALLYGGLISSVVYVLAVILGGALYPGYSHLRQAVSELLAAGAPNAALLDTLFTVYNLLAGLFGLGLWLAIAASGRSAAITAGKIGALLQMLQAPLGILQLVFSQDLPGSTATTAGSLHLVFAGASSLFSMLTILLVGLWQRTRPSTRGAAVYSFISLAVVFISGGFAAYTAASGGALVGLTERITIGAFIQWLFVTAIILLKR